MKALVLPTALPIAMIATLLAAAPAAAQLSPKSDGPIDIAADVAEVAQSACSSTWRGNAEALQGDARLRADVIRAFFEAKPKKPGGASNDCGDLTRLEAEGSVYYVTPDRRVRSDAATYEAKTETIVMTGDVVAVQGQNVLRGSRMVINAETGEGRMVGTAAGPNQTGRPRAVFYPSKKTQSPSK
ncbi:LptA/OstA family protein [Phenylobacterium sp.]|uniref:LptA/OstA family protein n=1 Tax=Phenylobacterium sp. TaxID=1871053 RepID=UPI00391AB7FD